MPVHLTRSLGSTWATLIVVVLLALAVASIAWAVRAMRRRPDTRPGTVLLFGAPVLFTTVAAAAWITIDEWDWLLQDGSVRSEGVAADSIELSPGEELFRIGDGSTVSYRVEERLAGADSTAVGTTTLVAGEIALDRARPSSSRIGEIVVNVEAFTSDSNLRDKRIRHDYLESTAFPYATFRPTSIDGLPDEAIADGRRVDVTIAGDLTVKETTAAETFMGWVELDGDELTAHVAATVLMSDYGIGPIAISGLVSTSDDVELEFDLVAHAAGTPPDDVGVFAEAATTVPVTTAASAPPTTSSTDGESPAGEATLTSFAGSVQPILEQHCASCHGPGGVGEATVAMATAGDAATLAGDIGLVTQSGYMPPWPAGPASVEFEHDWSLTDVEVEAIRAWIKDGAPLDLDASTRLMASGSQISQVDADETLRGEPYTGSETQRDDYRCQVYALSESDVPRWITNYAILPDQVAIVHHAILFRARGEVLDEAIALDAQDVQPGWPCFGLAGLNGVDQIGGWAPGQQPKDYPEGTGLRFDPGDFVIVQFHYHYDHDFPADRSGIAIDLASPEEVAAAGGALRDVDIERYLAPAEIPCRDDEEGPLCDRAAVITQIREKFGGFAAIIPDGLVRICGADLHALMADTDGVAGASCEYGVSNPGLIVGVFGHMHEFGQTFRMTLNPGTPDERVLLDIPNWTFDWQLDYRPVESIVVDTSDVIRVECTWDRSLAPMPEPRYVTWSEGTEDEMCYSILATVAP